MQPGDGPRRVVWTERHRQSQSVCIASAFREIPERDWLESSSVARIIQIDWSQINLIPFDIDTNFGLNYLRLKGHVFCLCWFVCWQYSTGQ